MLPFKKILFPVDYSPACEAIAPYVREMACRFEANLTLVHALTETFAFERLNHAFHDLAQGGLAKEAEHLREFADRHFPAARVEMITELGEPAGAIRRVVKHQGIDLVMMPTRGRGLFRRFLLGSVTAKTLHDLDCAVWTATGEALQKQPPGLPCQSILCCYDGGEEAEAVLVAAASLACNYKARLSIVQVLEAPASGSEIDLTPYIDQMTARADTHLRDTKRKLNIDAPHHVVYGILLERLLSEAIEKDEDLMVTGRGDDQRTFGRLWSNLYPLVRDSPCPVLSV
jgi:nucleotide-binding universal stress UspA family protein